MLIDTHCHLFNEYYSNLDELIKEMEKENIYAIVNGCNSKTSEEVILLSKKYKNIYASIGYHPTEIEDISQFNINELKDNINNVVAIGEIGLDYYWNKDNKDFQIELLKRQLAFAEEHKLPVIIHNREATMDIYNILKEYNVKGVIHAFSGSYEMAIKFIDLGFKLGIGGVITFKNSKLKDVIEKIDIKNIVLETDSPYLTPEPNRGKINSPLNLKYIAQFISKLKDISYDEVVKITTNNACCLFDLK